MYLRALIFNSLKNTKELKFVMRSGKLSKKVLSIPVHPALSENDIQLVCNTIRNPVV